MIRHLLLIFMLFCLLSDSAFASGSLDISIGSGGITITPSSFPDLSGDSSEVRTEVSQNILQKAKEIAQLISAICALICFTVFIVSVAKLSLAPSNPILRRMYLVNLLWSGIALSFFGGIWVIVTFFWNLFL